MPFKKLLSIMLLASGTSLAATTYTLVESKTLPDDLPYDKLVDLRDQYGADKVVYGSPFIESFTLHDYSTTWQNGDGKYFVKGEWTNGSETLNEVMLFTTGNKDKIIRTADLTYKGTGSRTIGSGLYYLLLNVESTSCFNLMDAEDPTNDDKSWRVKMVSAMLTPEEQQAEITDIKRPLAYHGTLNNLDIDLQIDPQADGYKGHLKLTTAINPGPGVWTNYCTMDKDVKLDLYK